MNKRIVSLLLCFVMVFAMLVTAVPIFAVGGTCTYSIEADKTTVSPGDTINFVVYMQQTGLQNTMEGTLVIPDGLSFVSDSGVLADGIENTLGWKDVAWTPVPKMILNGFGADSFAGTEKVALMKFQCTVDSDATEKDYEVKLTDLVADDENYDTKNPTCISAIITVKAATKSATGIDLNKSATTVYIGNTAQLTATLTPSDTTDTVTWSSSNEAVATVDENGVVTAVSEGEAIITAKANDTVSATCTVTVEKAPCKHENKTEHPAVTSTCITLGNNLYYTCNDCSKVFKVDGTTETTIEAETFTEYGEHKEKTPATCTSQAICEVCEQPYGELKPHDFSEKLEDAEHLASAGDCQTLKTYYYDCANCDLKGTETFEGTTYGEHNVSETWSTENGRHFHKCTVVGCDYTEDEAECGGGEATCTELAVCSVCLNEYGKLAEHEYKTEWNPGDENGHWHDCKNCIGHDEQQPHIPGAEATEDTPQTCTECGYIITPATGHVKHTADTSEWLHNETQHWHKCIGCEEKMDVGNHTGGEATCTSQAICEVCEQPYGELNADNHKGETEIKNAAEETCGEDGYSGDTYCLDCGNKIESGTVIPATGNHTDEDGDKICDVCEADLSCKHTGEIEIQGIVEATCGEDGYSGDTYCKDCGEKIKSGTVIPATGNHIGGEATCISKAICEICEQPYGELNADNHKGETEIKNATEETCGEDGYSGDTYCKDCGSKIKSGDVIPATGNHTDEDGDKICDVCEADLSCKHTGEIEIQGIVEATCGEDGYSGDTYCKDCGEKIADGTIIPATGKHTPGKWIIDKEATTEEIGIRHKECVVCGLVLETEEIPIVNEIDSRFDFNDWYFSMAQLMNQKFTVTAEAGEGGFISNRGKTSVKYNRSIKYTITPEDGYEIEAVYVNGRNIGAVSEYTFKNVKSNQKISATFVKSGWDNPFVDIFETDAYYKAIEFVYENGLFKGISATEFAPDTTMTRAMFVTVLGRLADVDVDDYTETDFDDVVVGSWYAPYVAWASKYGIVNGYGDGKFGVEDEITVEQAVVIMARYAEYAGIDTDSNARLTSYSDADDVSEWAINQMKWAVDEDIYNGKNGKLNPKNPAHRALIAEILYAFVGIYE